MTGYSAKTKTGCRAEFAGPQDGSWDGVRAKESTFNRLKRANRSVEAHEEGVLLRGESYDGVAVAVGVPNEHERKA